MQQRKISQSIRVTQSYRRQDFLPSPNDFPMYSESASICKLGLTFNGTVRISQILIAPNTFRSKQALNNPVSVAFVFGNDLESIFTDSLPKKLDPGINEFSEIIAPNQDFPILKEDPDVNFNFPKVLAYHEIPEFSDYPTNLDPNYNTGNIVKILRDIYLDKHIADIFMLQSSSALYPPSEILYENYKEYKNLYIIPYFDSLQRTEVVITARINFLLEC